VGTGIHPAFVASTSKVSSKARDGFVGFLGGEEGAAKGVGDLCAAESVRLGVTWIWRSFETRSLFCLFFWALLLDIGGAILWS
jgi:hypothetical protein